MGKGGPKSWEIGTGATHGCVKDSKESLRWLKLWNMPRDTGSCREAKGWCGIFSTGMLLTLSYSILVNFKGMKVFKEKELE